jgi:hypothetical protein
MWSTLSTRSPATFCRTGLSLSERGQGLISIWAAFEVDGDLVEEEDTAFGVIAGGIAFGAKTESNLWVCLKPKFAILGWMDDPFKSVMRSFVEGSAAYFPRQGA